MTFKSAEAGILLPGWLQMLVQTLEPAALAALETFIGDVLGGLPTTPPTTVPAFVAALIADLKPAALAALQAFIATLTGTSAAPAPPPAA